MGDALPFLIIAGLLGSFGVLAYLAIRVRRRGTGGDVLANILAANDELWYPTAHDSHWELRLDEERKAPVPTPDRYGKGRGRGRRR